MESVTKKDQREVQWADGADFGTSALIRYKEIVVLVYEERVMVLENRRGSEKDGRVVQVRVSVQKSKEPGKMKPMKRAANY